MRSSLPHLSFASLQGILSDYRFWRGALAWIAVGGICVLLANGLIA